jgi:hypothetical protein
MPRLPWLIQIAPMRKLLWRLVFGNPNKEESLCIFRREAFAEIVYRWDRLNRWWQIRPTRQNDA